MTNLWPYQSLGRQDKPTLLLLHGFLGSGSDWLPIAQQCADQFYCVMPDLPGHGQNIHLPLSAPLNFDTLAAELQQLLTSLSPQPVHLVGYSMGGRIALVTATKFPQHIRSLTLEGTSPGLIDAAARLERALLDDQRANQLINHGIEPFVEDWYNMALFSTLQQYPQRLETVKARRKQNSAHWAAKVIADLSPGRQPPVWSELAALPMPVMLLAGALDSKYTTLAQTIATKISKATIAIVPDCGHNIHLENPTRFTELLMRFLAQNC